MYFDDEYILSQDVNVYLYCAFAYVSLLLVTFFSFYVTYGLKESSFKLPKLDDFLLLSNSYKFIYLGGVILFSIISGKFIHMIVFDQLKNEKYWINLLFYISLFCGWLTANIIICYFCKKRANQLVKTKELNKRKG